MALRSQKTASAAGPRFSIETDPNAPANEADDALGIGDDEDAPATGDADIAALLANPAFAKAIDAIVASKLSAAGAAPVARESGSAAAFEAFLSKFDHMLEVQAEQRPGYIKPLGADEIDRRRQGRVDMFALLRQYKDENVWPHYLLGDIFYGPSANGPMLYEAGQEIHTRLPPADHFKPLNEPAVMVYEAYKRWVGEVLPIEDLIAQAAADARGGAPVVEIANEVKTLEPEVRLVDKPARDVAPRRVLGTVTPELLRGKPMPNQPNTVGQPAGPIFVAAEG